ncbi:TonB family protein [Pseudoalteromonas sp. KS88]|uniref:TonB family protein n=1 Tax=Pseudoalteromonas sp. KS88 TaxID=2109918 RepID=UPI001FDA7CCF|nr:TonB family protein [Pseudoalteromonas sp. KS88]
MSAKIYNYSAKPTPCFLFLKVCIFVCGLLFGFNAKADLLSATLDYHQGKFSKAKQEFLQLAQLGNPDAIYNIAVMYLHGQGVEKNTAQAYAWFSLAADFGLVDARDTAMLIANQTPNQQPLNDAYNALLKQLSFAWYNEQLRPELNSTETFNSSIVRDYMVEPNYPEHAYKNGIEGWVWLEFDIDESGAVTDITIIDSNPEKTFDKAIINAVKRWHYQASKEHLPYYNRSLIYHFTTFKGKQYAQSFKSQQRQYNEKITDLIDEAEQGNAIVQYYIANWLSSDEYNATRLLKYHWQHSNASDELLLKSATNGYANSQYRIGANLLRGEYGKVEREKGLNWVLLAAQNGLAQAQYRLGRELLDKKYLDYAPNKALKWLTAAAKQGLFSAKRELTKLLYSFEDADVSAVKRALNSALADDPTHPPLLLIQAKIIAKRDPEAAKRIALQALNEAKSRNWFTGNIDAFIASQP